MEVNTPQIRQRLADAAAQLAARGWAVFPLRERDKTPLRNTHGCKDATTDPAQVRAWWAKARHNIGIATGPASGLVVIDLDSTEAVATWAALEAEHGHTDTLSVNTARGLHLYFAYDGGDIGNRANIAPGIDVRGAGGYVVAPPSIHPSGKFYAWAEGAEAMSPAPLPEWLREALQKRAERAVRAEVIDPAPTAHTNPQNANSRYLEAGVRDEVEAVRNAHNGTRNDTLNRAAYNLGQLVAGGALEAVRVEAELRAAGEAVGLDAEEIAATIRSGLTAAAAKPRSVPKRTLAQKAKPAPEAAVLREAAAERSAGYVLRIPDGIDLADFAPHDAGNADACLAVLRDDFRAVVTRYDKGEGVSVAHWTGTHWELGCTGPLYAAVENVLRERAKAGERADRKDIVRASTPDQRRVMAAAASLLRRTEFRVERDALDTQPHLFNAANCTIDLRSGAAHAHNRADFFTWASPVEYDPNADRSAWENFLRESVAGGDDVAAWLQEFAGYTATGETNLEAMVYLWGAPRSGKTTTVETIAAALGPVADAADFSTFAETNAGRFDLSAFVFSRMVRTAESESRHALNPARIKRMTGGDMIRTDVKYGGSFDYRPRFKIWMTSNHPVKTDAEDEAAWQRLRVVNFPNGHAGREDFGLKDRLRTPAALRGVLAWIVEGAVRYYSRGSAGVPTPAAVIAETSKARQSIDYVAQWLEACTVADPQAFAATAELRRSYAAHCEAIGAVEMQADRLSKALEARGYARDVVKIKVRNMDTGAETWRTTRGHHGLRLVG